VESYVDHYGKESAGFLHYSEFKHIYETHAAHALEEGGNPAEEGKLSALFSLFDVTSRGKIAR
jgi:Ca2+-binding EF-hand superfamily protein